MEPYVQPAILGQTVFLQKRPDKVQTMTLAELNSMYQITGLPNTIKAVWRVTAEPRYGLFRREHSTALAYYMYFGRKLNLYLEIR